jgi:hypothetical protein
MRPLTIVVPYREREAHLKRFVPHLKAFFTWEKVHRDIPYRVLIVEQERGLPFNAGALRNIGFVLARDDSVKASFDEGFHDIDYLPMAADYTWTDVPAPTAWYGAEMRPLVAGVSGWQVVNNPQTFFGGVVLTPNDAFSRVNGYSNLYWGWGWQDVDLRTRFIAAGITPGRRRGRFLPLDHDNRGYTRYGTPAPIALVNEWLYRDKWAAGGQTSNDGLSSLQFGILDRREIEISFDDERPARLGDGARADRHATIAGAFGRSRPATGAGAVTSRVKSCSPADQDFLTRKGLQKRGTLCRPLHAAILPC